MNYTENICEYSKPIVDDFEHKIVSIGKNPYLIIYDSLHNDYYCFCGVPFGPGNIDHVVDVSSEVDGIENPCSLGFVTTYKNTIYKYDVLTKKVIQVNIPPKIIINDIGVHWQYYYFGDSAVAPPVGWVGDTILAIDERCGGYSKMMSYANDLHNTKHHRVATIVNSESMLYSPLQEVTSLLPVILPVVIVFIAIRKGITFVYHFLRGA